MSEPYLIIPEIPQDVIDRLVASTKEKLPDVDDAVIRDVIATNIQIVREHFRTLA